MYHICDFHYYKIAMMAFLCLFIENAADSSYLSGKGMGYFMILGVCLNMTRYNEIKTKSLKKKYVNKRYQDGNKMAHET